MKTNAYEEKLHKLSKQSLKKQFIFGKKSKNCMLSKNYILPSEKLYPAFCQRTFNLGILWQHMQHRKCCAFGVDRTTIIYQKQSNSNPRMHCTDTIIGKNHLSFTFHRVVHWYRGMYDPLPKTCFSM